MKFEGPFSAVRTAIWSQALLCVGMLIAALLPDRGLLYRAAIDELIAVGIVHLDEAAMLRRVRLLPEGLDPRGLTRDEILLWLEAGRTRDPDGPGSAEALRGFAPRSIEETLDLRTRFAGLGLDVPWNIQAGAIVGAQSEAFPERWRAFDPGATVETLMSYAGRGNPVVEVAVPDLNQPWVAFGAALPRSLVPGLPNDALLVRPIAPPQFFCDPGSDVCELTVQLDDEIPGGAVEYIQSTVPALARSGALEWSGSTEEAAFLGNGPEALPRVQGEIVELPRLEAIARLRELASESERGGSIEAFGVAVNRGILPTIGPLLVTSTAGFLLVLVRALARLRPSSRDLKEAFVAPLLPSVGGLVVAIVLIVLLPLAAQASLLARYFGPSRDFFADDTDWLVYAAVVGFAATAGLSAATVRRLRQILRDAPEPRPPI